MPRIGRRAFLVLASLWPVACRRPPQPVSLDEFLALSVRVTGHSELDRTLAATYLEGFLSTAGAARLRRPDAALEHEILVAWYTGIQKVNGQDRQVTHLGALQWRTIRVAPPGTCAGAFGAWADAPAANAL